MVHIFIYIIALFLTVSLPSHAGKYACEMEFLGDYNPKTGECVIWGDKFTPTPPEYPSL